MQEDDVAVESESNEEAVVVIGRLLCSVLFTRGEGLEVCVRFLHVLTKEFHKTRVNELGKDNFSELTKNGRVKGVKVWKSECDLFEF